MNDGGFTSLNVVFGCSTMLTLFESRHFFAYGTDALFVCRSRPTVLHGGWACGMAACISSSPRSTCNSSFAFELHHLL